MTVKETLTELRLIVLEIRNLVRKKDLLQRELEKKLKEEE